MEPKPPISLVKPAGTSRKLPEPPRPLGPAGLDLWNSVQAEFSVTDVGGVQLLLQLGGAADRLAELEGAIAADGSRIRTKNGMRAHPLLREEIAIRGFIVRTLARLGILDEPVNVKPGRPPGRW
jgi:hypothetical protein